jgi:hypothetical protein
MLPALFVPPHSDSLFRARRLRSEHLGELKNTVMMAVLCELPWFVAYRAELDEHRRCTAAGRITEPPPYPRAAVEEIERKVDAFLVDTVDPQYVR